MHAVEHVLGHPPRCVRADREERPVRKVEHAHQAVDEREPRGNQEVHRAQSETRDRQEDERPPAGPPAETLSSLRTSSGCSSSSCAPPECTTLPWSRTTTSSAIRRTTPRFCSTRSTVGSSESRSSTGA